jgi:hypothetical protein
MATHAAALAGAHRYEVGPLGGALWGLVKRAGGAPEDALAALAALYPPRGQSAPVAAPGPLPQSVVSEEDRKRFGVVRAPPKEPQEQQAPPKEG